MDLIAVRLHSGEGFDRDVLQEEGERVSGPGARPSCSGRTAGLPRGQAQRRDQKGSVHVFCAPSVLPYSMLIQFSKSITMLNLGSLILPMQDKVASCRGSYGHIH